MDQMEAVGINQINPRQSSLIMDISARKPWWNYQQWLHTVQIKSQVSLQWRHNGPDSVSNHQPHHCLVSRLFGRRSKKTSKFRVTGLCAGNSQGTGEIHAQMTSNTENVSIWWRHRVDVYGWTGWYRVTLKSYFRTRGITAIVSSKLSCNRWIETLKNYN